MYTLKDAQNEQESLGLTTKFIRDNLRDGQLAKAAKSILADNEASWPKVMLISQRDIVNGKSQRDKLIYVASLILSEIGRLDKEEMDTYKDAW